MSPALSIFGRTQVLVEKLAKALHDTARVRGDHTDLQEIRRGYRFKVQVLGPEGDLVGIATVSIELDEPVVASETT